MALLDIDRRLLDRCLANKPGAWQDFVNQYLGLIIHAINHTAKSRSIRLTEQDREDLCSEVCLAILKDDFAVLRHFRGQSSLSTYLTVVARRVIVREILSRKSLARLSTPDTAVDPKQPIEERINDRDEVQRLLLTLEGEQAEAVRLYHLEGKSYHEISTVMGISENSIGPMLSRAREKMRVAAEGAK